ncbi:GNAT family N-acetyltransferase [Aliiroseovarius sp. PTFE2010]|uniref:GNAT family N-acetyltransferase n=1 Tax=Aliiroseovarius sp. PTFE2010 TaxID=3417190 RepID=UPI003CFA791E
MAPPTRSFKLDYLVFASRLQRIRDASEEFTLLTRWAFEVGYWRFEWECSAANLASRRAAQRLWFSCGGVFRQAAPIKGRNGDMSWFAAIDGE